MLTERREKLLRIIIDEYVNTAQPVGSSALVEKYRLPYSPATVRNEMAALEEDGFITHPHTSAGRIPTDAGYRYYVGSLMKEETPSADLQQTIRHQFHQAARELEEWARLAAAILAARLNNAAVVTTPHSPEPRLRWVELVGVHDYLALLVVVLQEARVLQQTLALEEPMTQDELTAIARKLNGLFEGMSAGEIRKEGLPALPIEASVSQAVASLLDGADAALGSEPSFMDGLRELLRQPEFGEGERVLRVIELLEDRNISRAIPAAATRGGDVTIVIGAEHPVDAMRLCSVVSTRYAGPAGLRGSLSVVGPTRMHYPRSVAMVRYMSSLMEELLGVYFA